MGKTNLIITTNIIFDVILNKIIIILSFLILIFAVGNIIWNMIPYGKDSTDGNNRSGMIIRIDNLTKCEYLADTRGGLTPRMDKKGRQICGKN